MQLFRVDWYLGPKVVIPSKTEIQWSLVPANVNSSRIFRVPAQGRDAGWGQEQLTKCARLRMNQPTRHDLV